VVPIARISLERSEEMRGTIGILAAVAAVGLFATAVNAAYVEYNADGSKTLTQDGWAIAPGYQEATPSKSKDWSIGEADSGTDGVWHIQDNNSGGNAYMRMWKNPGVDQSQGIVLARIKLLSGDNTAGTFGYTTSGGDADGSSVMVGVRASGLNIKSAEGDITTLNSGATIPVPGSMADYRVYALKWTTGGVFDIWVSNGSDWSANESDWTKLATAGGWPANQGLKDYDGTIRTGLCLGSFGGSSAVSDVKVDWLRWSKNSEEQAPWLVPEPTMLTLLALGMGVLLRRRR
jgi:hypothetical protein